MTFSPIDFIPVLGGLLVIIGYAFILIYVTRAAKNKKKFHWQQRLGKNLDVPENEKAAALSLIKENPSPDTFLKSKLPKVEGFREWIQHSGLDIHPTVFLIVAAVLGLIICLLFFVLVHLNFLLSFLIGMLSSFVLPWVFFTFLINRRKKIFLQQFPIALDMIRRALRAGHSSERALDMVAEQMSGPVGESFRMIVDRMHLGEPVESILADMSNRIGIDDFRMLAIVLVLQRETGGSLAESVESFAKVMRDRQNLQKKMKALSAEIRVTASILALLPFFILGAVYFTQPNYFDPLFYTETGNKLLIVGSLLFMTGISLIIRMVKKDIY